TGLVDASGNAIGGPFLEGARAQLMADPENFGAWTVDGAVGRTGGQADPFGGTGACLLDSNATSGDDIHEAVTFTGNATKALSIFLKQGTSTLTRLALWNGSLFRHRVNVTWSGGVPSLATVDGAGTLF